MRREADIYRAYLYVSMKTFTGIDLIEKIIEFKLMTPDESQWDESIITNEPRLIRLKRINSLISAFFPKPSKNTLERVIGFFSERQVLTINDILKGRFISLFEEADYKEIYSFMINYLKSHEMRFSENEGKLRSELIFEFSSLVEYKIDLYKLISANSGRYNSGIPGVTTSFTICLTETINKAIAGNYKDLDEAIELIVNPRRLRFTKEELIKNYKYPTEDLEKIDFDNW